MVKPLSKPSFSQSTRRMRTHMLWKVDTHMPRAPGPTSLLKRSRISAAALLVNVIARISQGCTPLSASICAMRYVSTRVLPEPAPASTSSGPSVHSTASRCAGFKESISMPVIYPPSTQANINEAPCLGAWFSAQFRTSQTAPHVLFARARDCLSMKPCTGAWGGQVRFPRVFYGNIPIVSNAK